MITAISETMALTVVGARGRKQDISRVTTPMVRDMYTTSQSQSLVQKDSGYEPDKEDNCSSTYSRQPEMQSSGTIKSVQDTLDYIAKYRFESKPTANDRLAERTKARSKSQSGIGSERKAYAGHYMRSSSSKRAERSQVSHQSDIFSVDILDDNSGLSNAACCAEHEASIKSSNRTRGRHGRSNSVGNDRPAFPQSHSAIHQPFERSLGTIAKILSPVTEIFGSEEVNAPRLDENVAAAKQDSRPRMLSTSNTQPTPAKQLLGNGQTSSKSPSVTNTRMLIFKHGEQFINPLAAHSTLVTNTNTTPQPARVSDKSRGTGYTVQSVSVDKPLPPCPNPTRSTIARYNALSRSTVKNGPGLEATSIMRPWSRPRQHQIDSQAQVYTTLSHNRSASMDHESKPTATISIRKVSCPNNTGRKPSQPSSAGSGFSSDQSISSAQTPESSFDLFHGRRSSMSPTLGYNQGHRLCEQSNPEQLPKILSQHDSHLSRGDSKPTSPVSGGLYHEIRDDLAAVARDLGELTLAAQQREQLQKLSKLRARARSTSRHDRRSDRQPSSDNFSSNYNYRDMDGSDMKGAWGNAAFVPNSHIVDDNHNKFDGEGEISTREVQIVPEYDELWG